MRIGDLFAPLIGAPAGTVAAQPNVTLASAIAASCIDFREGRNKIVTSELHFPSLLYMHRQLERQGARLEVVPCPDGRTVPLERLLEAIDERTALVPISHVIFKSSFRQDVEAVVARAHECGARVVVDVYQSAGILPVDVTGWGVDFAVGGALKWLCGGPGVAFLYARPDLSARLEPALTGWQAHHDPFAFDSGPQRYRDDGWRYLTGTPQIPALFAAKTGLEILGRLNLDAVRHKSSRQTQRVIDFAVDRGWSVVTPLRPEQRGGAVTVSVPDAERCTRELLARDVLVDFRSDAGIRLAPPLLHRGRRDRSRARCPRLASRRSVAAGRVDDVLERIAREPAPVVLRKLLGHGSDLAWPSDMRRQPCRRPGP